MCYLTKKYNIFDKTYTLNSNIALIMYRVIKSTSAQIQPRSLQAGPGSATPG